MPAILDTLSVDDLTYAQTPDGYAWRATVTTAHPTAGTVTAHFTGLTITNDRGPSGALGTLNIDDPHADILITMTLTKFTDEYFGRLDNMADALFETMASDELGDIIESTFRA